MPKKLEDLSLRQIAIGVPAFGFVNWALLQFVFLPKMLQSQRDHLYAGSNSYLYSLSIAFIIFAYWFTFRYRGQYATHGRKIVVFAMALGSLCGMIMMFAIRAYWHI
jgi:hypothetical protein